MTQRSSGKVTILLMTFLCLLRLRSTVAFDRALFTIKQRYVQKNPAFAHRPCSASKLNSRHSIIELSENKRGRDMPRGTKKENLPSKMCVVCNRPFTWRKKWERCWEEVTCCSKSCNAKRRGSQKRVTGSSVDSSMISVESSSGITHILETSTHEPVNHHIVAAVNVSKLHVDLHLEKNLFDETSIELTQNSLTETDLMESLNIKLYGTTSIQSTSTCWNDKEQESVEIHFPVISDELFHDLNALDDLDEFQTSSQSSLDGSFEVPFAAQNLRAQRKIDKKARKAERRALRQGLGHPTAGQKQCMMCDKDVNLLIRCICDSSRNWKMVCGKCWKHVSGGVVDGDEAHPYYRYGGLWKNRQAQMA